MSDFVQKINEGLASGKFKDEVRVELNKANSFLLNQADKEPVWLQGFFTSNCNKMKETIFRAMRSGGMASLSGYKEGYFNEIIQNANDLHCGTSIEVQMKVVGHEKYRVTCKYYDKGFSLSNIYGFLNREMSDKSASAGQTGKFGIGIKSFFQFVDTFSVKSNVNIQFDIQREDKDHTIPDVIGSVEINKEWNQTTTELEFTFRRGVNSDNFNTEKLVSLISYLNSNSSSYDPELFVADGEVSELVFDFRSLLFMGAIDNQIAISNIKFKGLYHTLELNCTLDEKVICTTEETPESKSIVKAFLSINKDGTCIRNEEYLAVTQGKCVIAVPCEDMTYADTDYKNRFYSTYFLRKDEDHFLPANLLIHTSYANMHRTDLGENEERINQACAYISNKLKDMYMFFCSESVGECKYGVDVSSVFHQLLLQYMRSSESYSENPLDFVGITTEYLPKYSDGTTVKYVVCHNDTEEYEKVSFIEGNIKKELINTYKEVIEQGEVVDFSSLIYDYDCIPSVEKLFNEIMYSTDEKVKNVCKLVNLYRDVRSFIGFRITDERLLEDETVRDAQIDEWLLSWTTEDSNYSQEILLKLIGRYQLNPSIKRDGTIDAVGLSFHDYIFNEKLEDNGGILSKMQSESFGKTYFGLKDELLQRRLLDNGNKERTNIRCIKPRFDSLRNWKGTFDQYVEYFSEENLKKKIWIKNGFLLLERLANEAAMSRYICIKQEYPYNVYLYEKEARLFDYRRQGFKYARVIEQQIIDITPGLNVEVDNFEKFLKAVQYKYQIPKEALRDRVLVKGMINSVSAREIATKILPLILNSERAEEEENGFLKLYKASDLIINELKENIRNEYSAENQMFVEKLTGIKIHLYRFESSGRKRVIAYAHNGKFRISIGASSKFIDISNYGKDNKNLYIFYDNAEGAVSKIISTVLKELKLDEKSMQLVTSYIYNGMSTKTLNYEAYVKNMAHTRRKLVLDWNDVKANDMVTIQDNEVLYRLLTARGSYDVFCPICADVPLETIDFQDINKRRHSRRLLILENESKKTRDQYPYIITVCCNHCFDRLKAMLSHSEFDGKNLILSTQLAHGRHEKLVNRQKIELSPVNISVMKLFKLK